MNPSDNHHQLDLHSDIRYLKGIGDKRAELFNKLGIETIGDLILHQPRKWEDFSHIRQIINLVPGQVMIRAQIVEVSGKYLGRRGLHLTEALVRDDSGYMRVIWFNQPYRVKGLKISKWYYLSGKYDLQYRHLQLINPHSELVSGDNQLGTDLIKGVYPATKGLKNLEIFKAIKQVKDLISDYTESLPQWMINEGKMKPLSTALMDIHFPKNIEQAEAAKHNLGIRELIALSISSLMLKATLEKTAHSIPVCQSKIEQVIDSLDFKLTNQQADLIWLILAEMNQGEHVLNRLIQGDVGSGKTVISLMVAYNLICNNYQVAFIAPTQILAEQHFKTINEIMSKFMKADEISLFHAGLKAKDAQHILDKLKSQDIKLIVGTQSLLSDRVKFANLALIIIDEQHRFGVEQRLKLLTKASAELSNVLTLSATPIPRSLALVIYADLDISLLTEKPPDRLPVKTTIIPLKDRAKQLKPILQTASTNNLVYVVCPAIDAQSEDSVKKIEDYLSKMISDLNYASLHGRQSAVEKDEILQLFKAGKIHVLISTSIIEAGIDIVKANHIIIMSPEQFGLAQLHQMRGRVGRHTNQGYCYLCPYSNQQISERLQALLDYNDGFKLSEIDLELRGPGTLYGLKQSGRFKISDFFKGNVKDIELARSLAEEFIKRQENIDDYVKLKKLVEKYQQITYLN